MADRSEKFVYAERIDNIERNAADDYLTPGEVSRLLHVSPKTINRWAKEGRIPCIITLGGHRRFRRDAVDAAVNEMSRLGQAPAN